MFFFEQYPEILLSSLVLIRLDKAGEVTPPCGKEPS